MNRQTGEYERNTLTGEEVSAFIPFPLPLLVRVGLLHVQFETLHPYLDGNGRLGRLLITLLLRHWRLLSRPLLYLSLFLKVHRREYYRLLSAVRTDGDWENWLAYFLEGVAAVAEEAIATARRLNTIVGESRERLLARDDATVFSLRLFELQALDDRKKNRTLVFKEYLDHLREGTEGTA